MENQVYVFGALHAQQQFLSSQKFAEVMAQAHQKIPLLQNYPSEKIFLTLERVGRRWRDRHYPYRQSIFQFLTEVCQMSPENANRDLDIVPQILQAQSLRKRLTTSLPYPLEVLDKWWRPLAFPGRIRALAQGVVVHICAGNVFLGALDSLLMGMITKNINIVKLSSQDPSSLIYFAQSLKEEDLDGNLAQSIAILQWGREHKDMEDVALQQADVILVWGGEEAVRAYKNHAATQVRVVGYGPKISFGVVTPGTFSENNFVDIVRKCAHDICIYDQKACSSPQNLFIPTKDKDTLRPFMAMLAQALEDEMMLYRPTQMDANELAELLKYRETMRFNASQERALLCASPDTNGYTVVYVPEPGLQISPLHRFIYVKSFSDIANLQSQVAAVPSLFLQTAGLYATNAEWADFEQALTTQGVTRIAELGKMLEVEDGSPHDGDMPLNHLIKWVGAETETRLPHSAEFLREFLGYIRASSPFYRKLWQGVDFTQADFFTRLPLVDKPLFYQNTPPDSNEIFNTSCAEHPIIFASGGSTGHPKYSYFTNQEFDTIAQALADQYLISGLSATDIVANLFVAGHLWSSFLAVDRALNKIGVTNLPIGGHLERDEIVKYLLAFRPNALFGLPSTITSLLNYCIERKITLQIDKIFYAGEHVAPSMVYNFKKHWGVTDIHSAGYASVDAGIVGYQCLCQAAGEHHLVSDLVMMELITPDGKIITEEGREGEIVVTSLYRRLMPIVRYRTGDLGMYTGKLCACGRRDLVFRLIGRCDDRLQIGGARIFVQDLDFLLAQYDFLTGVYQFVPQYKDDREFLEIFIEYQQYTEFPPNFVEEFWRKFLDVFTDMELSIKQKWLPEPDLIFVQEGIIPRIDRTQKVKLIQDKRR